MLPHLEIVPAIIVSVNTSYGKHGYCSILSFVGRQMELPGCNTFRIPHCDVFFTVNFARSIGIIQRRVKSVDAHDLARRWMIPIDRAKRTVKKTSQRGIRKVLHPGSFIRRLTNDRGLVLPF